MTGAFNGLGMDLGSLARLSDAQTRSISAENPTGAKGQGGMATEGTGAVAARELGRGWKVSPSIDIAGQTTVTLADIEGPGAVQHIWLTVHPTAWRRLVLRCYWDGEDAPSVETPLGDFFCNGWGVRCNVNSLPIAVNPAGGFNSYWEMPFRRHARVTLENLSPDPVKGFYYQITYTLTHVPDDRAYLHAQWRRSNPLPYQQVHTLLDGVAGQGHYVGTYLAWGAHNSGWWGEGEVKFYVDDDRDFPSLCSTGLEDYAGGAWAFQDALRADPPPQILPFSSHSFGLSQALFADATAASPFVQHMPAVYSVYRWHEQDPIWFDTSLRVEVQQIGAWDGGLFERSDDVATVAYWYATVPQPSRSELGTAASRRPR